MQQTFLKEYIRDEKNQNPIGIAVAVRINDEIFYGFSICNKLDRFDKQRGLDIALRRAHADEYSLPLSARYQTLIDERYTSLENRAMKYFQDIPSENISFVRNAVHKLPHV